MTTILVLSTIAAFLGGLVALPLWREFRRTRSASQGSFDPNEILLAPPAREAYRPVGRLFASGDFEFLTRQGSRPEIAKRLRRARWQVLRLYLRDLQADFRRVYRIAGVLAAKSQDPAFGALVTRQAVRFYRELSILHICCFLGWPARIQTDVLGLVEALDRLREAARASLVATAPRPDLSFD